MDNMAIDFKNLIDEFILLEKTDKRNEVLSELKILIFTFEKLATERGINTSELRSREIQDLKNNPVSEDDFLEALYVYMQVLIDRIGAALYNPDNINKNE